ncbi:sugar phosphate isomerase/epimerase [bacterium]|nr:sugar phosphate isomerase/epimerase [bacterium]
MITVGGRAHTIAEINKVGKLGYPFAEINIDDPVRVKEDIAVLRELKASYDMYFLAHYPNEGNPNDLKNLRENFLPRLKQLIAYSADLDIHKGTMHFWMDKRWTDASVIAAKIEMLAELVDFAETCELVLCLENLSAQHDSFSMFFEAIPNLRMTMDIGHGELLSKENTAFGFMENVFSKIAHVHVHDNLGGNSVKDDLHLALGDGIVDYPRILALLKEKGYQSTITMEVKPGDMPRTLKVLKAYI